MHESGPAFRAGTHPRSPADCSLDTRPNRAVAESIEQRRTPEDIRHELDLGDEVDGDHPSVQVHAIRSHWQHPNETLETPVATVTYVERRDVWKLYWIRRAGDWHKYEPAAEVVSLKKALEVVDADAYHCFWGWPAATDALFDERPQI